MTKKVNWSQSLSVSTVEENYTHSFSRIALIIFTILTFLFSLIVNVINSVNAKLLGFKVFEFSSNNVISSFQTNVSPSPWFSYIWIFIFMWQISWLIYGVSTIFRKSSSDYLYKYPPVMHWLIYLNFSVVNMMNVICLFLWSNRLFLLASIYSLLMAVGLYISTFTSMFKLSDYQREMYYTEKTTDVWSIRFLVQNGMILYASWSFIMFLYTLNLSLVFEYHFTKETSHLIIIGLIFVKMLCYFYVENYLAYAYCKFLFTSWLIYALFLFDTLITQMLIKNKLQINTSELNLNSYNGDSLEKSLTYKKLNVNFLLHTCLISAWFFLFIAKLIKFIWNEFCSQRRNTL